VSAIGPITSTGTGGVSTDTSRLASKDSLQAAGKRFESIFVNMMLKSMRQANLGEGLFDSKASEQFRDMQDQQLSQSMAEHAPIGIGKALTSFLAKAAAAGAPQGVDAAPTAMPAPGGAQPTMPAPETPSLSITDGGAS
jgi:flagellar protein FlgJ